MHTQRSSEYLSLPYVAVVAFQKQIVPHLSECVLCVFKCWLLQDLQYHLHIIRWKNVYIYNIYYTDIISNTWTTIKTKNNIIPIKYADCWLSLHCILPLNEQMKSFA